MNGSPSFTRSKSSPAVRYVHTGCICALAAPKQHQQQQQLDRMQSLRIPRDIISAYMWCPQEEKGRRWRNW
ncbi:hypothetical protein ZHAS_00019986 [Anopheles sinensis]|uniref:Uncharacterized protein n=1 Tax=Anopheles sinensis TaxID=74873 RepID=A0A084WNN6_ANOSI|nr:hypothetical protein ZHAS_00019986 [Anopheles sinensis]